MASDLLALEDANTVPTAEFRAGLEAARLRAARYFPGGL